MNDIVSTIPACTRPGAGQMKGRARGALICGVFGSVWMFEGVFFGGMATPAWLAATTLLTVASIAWPAAQLRSLRHLPVSPADRQFWKAISTWYWTDVAVEWLACTVAVNWLGHIRRYDLIPEALGIIIGLHFLLLAKIFKAPLYYATGIVMISGVLTSLIIPAGSVRNIAACGVNGLVLWATCALSLYRNRPFIQIEKGLSLSLNSSN